MSRTRAALSALTAVAALTVTPERAWAVDPFEVQVYDGTANAPGAPGLELHMNRVFDGVKTSEAPALPLHQQTHMTLEPSMGLTNFLELGGYLQTALRPDGTFDYAGAKVRTKFILPDSGVPHLRLGVNLELSLLPEKYDPSRVASEVRPIVAWENERWLFAVNPIVGIPIGTPDRAAGPTFEPAAMAKVKLFSALAVGAEYYAGLGPIGKLSPWNKEEHYVYEAIDITSLGAVEINFGVGEGLTNASNALVAKVILGYSFDGPHGNRGTATRDASAWRDARLLSIGASPR